MADYTQTTFFTVKDGLASGNPLKLIKGSEFDAEYDAISTAIGTKVDTAGAGIDVTDKTISLSLSGLTTATIALTDELAFADTSDSGNPKKTTLASAVDAFATGGVTGIDHDSGVLRVDPSLATVGTLAADDEIVFADVDNTDALRKAPIKELAGLIVNPSDGTKEVDDKIEIDINSLALLSGTDPDDDFLAVYDDSAGSHKKIVPKEMIEAVMGAATSAETDDIANTDYLYYIRGQEALLLRQYHEGKRTDYTLISGDTIAETEGNHNLIMNTGAATTLYLPTASTVPVGWQTTVVSWSTGDVTTVQPTGTDTQTSVVRGGTTTAGKIVIPTGGTAHIVKTSAGGYNAYGDIT